MAVELNHGTFNPMLVKPKGGKFSREIVNKQLKIVNKFSKVEKDLSPLKRILALPT